MTEKYLWHKMEVTAKKNTKNKYGQYFTPEVIVDFMIELADISATTKILEPSCGKGIFLKRLIEYGFNNIIAYEIDEGLAREFINVRYESFVSANIEEQFDLIIGNPPYIRWKNLEPGLKQELANNHLWNKYCNALCDYLYIFILKSIELLQENGQLIFICPEYWMNTTHSLSLRNYMMTHGYFEEIYHFNETPIFDQVTVSIVIFKYIKNKEHRKKIKLAQFYAQQRLTVEVLNKLMSRIPIKDATYSEVSQFRQNERWLLKSDEVKSELAILEKKCVKQSPKTLIELFDPEKICYHTIGDFCDIGNGMVSGLDKAFQVNGHPLNDAEQKALLKVIKAKDLNPFYSESVTNYIFIENGLNEEEFINRYPHFYQHFEAYKIGLENRYQYNRKINYWEWVFLRNLNLFNRNEKRIFVPCKERISNKDFFRFALVNNDYFPTQDVTAIFKKNKTKESIEYITAYLNQPFIFDWLKCNGIIKGNIVEFSEKPISSIPFKKIDWKHPFEVNIHNHITDLTQKYIIHKDAEIKNEITELFQQLFQTQK